MCQFDDYINSILKDLKISKNEKKELAEEFLDHLLMLKQEYLSKGLTESDAVKQAMNSFGKENALKRNLSDSYSSYRSFINIFTGIILFLMLYRIAAFTPVPALFSADNIFVRVFILSISSIILFMPMGYFLPIFFKQKKTIHIIVLMSATGLILLHTYTFCSFYKFLIELGLGIIWNLTLPMAIDIIAIFVGYILGFALLKLIHNVTMVCKGLAAR